VTGEPDTFCAFCFGPLPADPAEARGRRYCSPGHADADRSAAAAGEEVDAFRAVDEYPDAPGGDQLSLEP
jgi:hypothetical protein